MIRSSNNYLNKSDMSKITTSAGLKVAIEYMELKKVVDAAELKEQLFCSYQSMLPVNIIKNTFSDLIKDADFKGDVLNASVSIATGYLSKKMVVGETHNPIKQLFGTLLQMGVTNLVAKNAEGIKSKAKSFFSGLFGEKENPAE